MSGRAALLACVALAAACAPRSSGDILNGRALFLSSGCASCHRVGAQGGVVGPDLTTVGLRHPRAWLEAWLEDPKAMRAATTMPRPPLSLGQRRDLASYLSTLRGQAFRAGTPPWDRPELLADPVRRGQEIFHRLGCSACHGVEASGGVLPLSLGDPKTVPPPLRGLASRFDRARLRRRLLTLKGGMPSLSATLKRDELDALISYLLTK